MAVAGAPEDALVQLRIRRTLEEISEKWETVSSEVLASAAAWRQFRWYRGQRHYSGHYWCWTTRGHVTYESRLELANLVLLDADPRVSHIVSQPFRLTAVIDGQRRAHVPDYLVIDADGLRVIDVKPARTLEQPEVTLTLNWTRMLVESRGWRYDVQTEVSPDLLATAKFLAGYRNSLMFDTDIVNAFAAENLIGCTVAEASAVRDGVPTAIGRAITLHLVWRGHFTIDMSRPLTGRTVLERGSCD